MVSPEKFSLSPVIKSINSDISKTKPKKTIPVSCRLLSESLRTEIRLLGLCIPVSATSLSAYKLYSGFWTVEIVEHTATAPLAWLGMVGTI